MKRRIHSKPRPLQRVYRNRVNRHLQGVRYACVSDDKRIENLLDYQDGRKIKIPAGNYQISKPMLIERMRNRTVQFESGAVLRAIKPTRMLMIKNCRRVTICNSYIIPYPEGYGVK